MCDYLLLLPIYSTHILHYIEHNTERKKKCVVCIQYRCRRRLLSSSCIAFASVCCLLRAGTHFTRFYLILFFNVNRNFDECGSRNVCTSNIGLSHNKRRKKLNEINIFFWFYTQSTGIKKYFFSFLFSIHYLKFFFWCCFSKKYWRKKAEKSGTSFISLLFFVLFVSRAHNFFKIFLRNANKIKKKCQHEKRNENEKYHLIFVEFNLLRKYLNCVYILRRFDSNYQNYQRTKCVLLLMGN